MPANIPPEVLQKQAAAEAPGQGLGDQAKPKNLTNGRQQPGVKQKSAAKKVYPKLASQSDGVDGED
jgi:hypothetical protein